MPRRLPAWICDNCTRCFSDDEPPPVCPGCGVMGAFSEREAHEEEAAELEGRPASLEEEPPRLPKIRTRIPKMDRLLAGGFVRGTTTCLHGARGAGKSTLALLAAAGLAESLSSSALVVCPEMSHEILSHTARGVKDRRRLVPLRENHAAWEATARRFRFPILLVDSISVFRDPLETMTGVINWARSANAIALVILQQTKGGDPAGAAALQFNVDAVLRLALDGDQRRLFIDEKCRWAPIGSTLL